MSIGDAADQAVQFWSRPDAINMVAIAGAESGWVNDIPSSTDVWGMPGEQAWWRPYSCNQVYSWGLWQIFMPVHREKLQPATGSTDPCIWRDYLLDPHNNAYIADQILRTQGFSAWSAYNDLSYRAFLHDAELAVDRALERIGPPVPRPPFWPAPTPILPPGLDLLYVRPVEPPQEGVDAVRELLPVEPPPW